MCGGRAESGGGDGWRRSAKVAAEEHAAEHGGARDDIENRAGEQDDADSGGDFEGPGGADEGGDDLRRLDEPAENVEEIEGEPQAADGPADDGLTHGGLLAIHGACERGNDGRDSVAQGGCEGRKTDDF